MGSKSSNDSNNTAICVLLLVAAVNVTNFNSLFFFKPLFCTNCLAYLCGRYWHRSLNPRKLIEVKFSHLSRNMTMQRTMKLYRLPEVCAIFFPG